MTPPPSLFTRWLATHVYPSILNSASKMTFFKQVTPKARKSGSSSLHWSLKKFILSIFLTNIPLSPVSVLVSKFCIFATWKVCVFIVSWTMGSFGPSPVSPSVSSIPPASILYSSLVVDLKNWCFAFLVACCLGNFDN